jgi:hypothetical protein
MAKSKSTAKNAHHTPPAARRRPAKPVAEAAVPPAPEHGAEPAPSHALTKQALIIGLLQRTEGATLADLVAATGWLPHTTRAALTRLRQAGHVLDKSKGETGATVYRIAAPAGPVRSRKAA